MKLIPKNVKASFDFSHLPKLGATPIINFPMEEKTKQEKHSIIIIGSNKKEQNQNITLF